MAIISRKGMKFLLILTLPRVLEWKLLRSWLEVPLQECPEFDQFPLP